MSSTPRSTSPTRDRGALRCRRARSPAPRSKDRLVKVGLAIWSFRASCRLSDRNFTGVCSNFTKFGKGFLNPSHYLGPGAGGEDVWRYFQPQQSETQEAS